MYYCDVLSKHGKSKCCLILFVFEFFFCKHITGCMWHGHIENSLIYQRINNAFMQKYSVVCLNYVSKGRAWKSTKFNKLK